MSYLSALRLHFAGQFLANVPTMDNSTVNHLRAAQGVPIPPSDEGFNKDGSGEFNLHEHITLSNGQQQPNCTVRSAFYSDGSQAQVDPIIGMSICDSGGGSAAKIVDLDPEQRMVPIIYGLQIRLLDSQGNPVFHGTFEPAAAVDLWARAPQFGHSMWGGGAYYQSVIAGLKWDNLQISRTSRTLAGSRFLFELHQKAKAGGKLSIKFNLDAFYTQNRGRIVGTIGPYEPGEPRHFIRGRHFLPRLNQNGDPVASLYHAVAVLDEKLNRLRVDLGNALPTTRDPQQLKDIGTKLVDLGNLNLECVKLGPGGNVVQHIPLGNIDYVDKAGTGPGNPGWYETFAGIAELAVPLSVMPDLRQNPFRLTLPDKTGWPTTALQETPQGLYLGSEMTECRLEAGNPPHNHRTAHLHATAYGKPLKQARVLVFLDPTGPSTGLGYQHALTTDNSGWAALQLNAHVSVQRRPFIDSQLFRLRYALEQALDPWLQYPFSPSDIISVLVWEVFKAETPKTTWSGTVKAIFQIYAALYPVMKDVVNLDLASYQDVCDNSDDIVAALSLNENHPHQMPVSRDLSPSKRQAILDWLKNPGPNGKPLF